MNLKRSSSLLSLSQHHPPPPPPPSCSLAISMHVRACSRLRVLRLVCASRHWFRMTSAAAKTIESTPPSVCPHAQRRAAQLWVTRADASWVGHALPTLFLYAYLRVCVPDSQSCAFVLAQPGYLWNTVVIIIILQLKIHGSKGRCSTSGS